VIQEKLFEDKINFGKKIISTLSAL